MFFGAVPLSKRPMSTHSLALFARATAADEVAVDLTTMTEPELTRMALAGERAAWGVLFRRHNRRVVLALLARGVRPDGARDATQDAWARLLEQSRRGKLTELTVPGLVITQALFIVRDRARRASASRPHVSLEHAPRACTGFEQRILDRDRLARARALLANCRPVEQHVFRLIYARPGVSATEVAAAVGISVQRVRQIVCEVRKKLRAAVEEDSHD